MFMTIKYIITLTGTLKYKYNVLLNETELFGNIWDVEIYEMTLISSFFYIPCNTSATLYL